MLAMLGVSAGQALSTPRANKTSGLAEILKMINGQIFVRSKRFDWRAGK